MNLTGRVICRHAGLPKGHSALSSKSAFSSCSEMVVTGRERCSIIFIDHSPAILGVGFRIGNFHFRASPDAGLVRRGLLQRSSSAHLGLCRSALILPLINGIDRSPVYLTVVFCEGLTNVAVQVGMPGNVTFESFAVSVVVHNDEIGAFTRIVPQGSIIDHVVVEAEVKTQLGVSNNQ